MAIKGAKPEEKFFDQKQARTNLNIPRSMSTRLHKLPGFLGLQRSTMGLLSMVMLVGMGERMAERFLPIYLIALGGSTIAVGLLNGMDNLLSALYSFPGGYLADRIGTKPALLIFNALSMGGYLIVILIPAWQAVLAGAVLFLSWSAISLPATMSLISQVLPSNKRTMGVSMHSLVRRIPMALGPILGGMCIALWGERGGAFLWQVSPQTNFFIAFVFGGIGTLAFGLTGGDVTR